MNTEGRRRFAQESRSFDNDVKNRAADLIKQGHDPWQAHMKAMNQVSEERMKNSIGSRVTKDSSSDLERFLKGLNKLTRPKKR